VSFWRSRASTYATLPCSGRAEVSSISYPWAWASRRKYRAQFIISSVMRSGCCRSCNSRLALVPSSQSIRIRVYLMFPTAAAASARNDRRVCPSNRTPLVAVATGANLAIHSSVLARCHASPDHTRLSSVAWMALRYDQNGRLGGHENSEAIVPAMAVRAFRTGKLHNWARAWTSRNGLD
jgi:hypothetical protein